jgi:hypothetical protein
LSKTGYSLLLAGFDAIVKGSHANVFDHFNAERLRDRLFIFSMGMLCRVWLFGDK